MASHGFSRAANILMVLALIAMLVGAVFLLLARAETPLRLAPGDKVVIVDHTARGWDPWGSEVRVRVFGPGNMTHPPANVTLTAQDGTGAGSTVENTSVAPRRASTWTERVAPGESLTVSLENTGAATVAAGATVTQRGNLWIGGILVAFGVTGFIFHRLGMRRM